MTEAKLVNGDKWVRSQDGVIAGVCRGLGESFGFAPNVLRLLWVLSVVFFGVGLFVYIGLAFTLPREDQVEDAYQDKLLGVCHRIHEKTNIDVGLVRFLCLLLAVSSLGATVVGYIVLYFVIPELGEKGWTGKYKERSSPPGRN